VARGVGDVAAKPGVEISGPCLDGIVRGDNVGPICPHSDAHMCIGTEEWRSLDEVCYLAYPSRRDSRESAAITTN